MYSPFLEISKVTNNMWSTPDFFKTILHYAFKQCVNSPNSFNHNIPPT